MIATKTKRSLVINNNNFKGVLLCTKTLNAWNVVRNNNFSNVNGILPKLIEQTGNHFPVTMTYNGDGYTTQQKGSVSMLNR